jgi:anti-anti-sigma factor
MAGNDASVTHEREGGASCISVSGEFDMALADEYRAALDAALETDEPLLVDLHSCTFIDSTGIALVIRAFQLAERFNLRFALVASGPQVRRVLEFVGVKGVIPTHTSREEALEALA